MINYEYLAASEVDGEALIPRLDSLGEDGWELVSVVYDTHLCEHVAFLKRPLPVENLNRSPEDSIP